MKIGFKPKSYPDVVCFEIPDDYKEKEWLINEVLSLVSARPENDLDLVVTVKSKSINLDESLT